VIPKSKPGVPMKKTFNRIGYLFKEPESRTKLLVFVLVGVVLSLSAILIQDPFWSDVLLQLAITFAAVAFVQILWDFLGGDPLELKLEDYQRSLKLLAVLKEEEMGIERIWWKRSRWQEDAIEGRKVWHKWVCEADKVCILSNTFWNEWLKYDDFCDDLFNNLRRGATIRIVLYHPTSNALRLRAEDEKYEANIIEMQTELYRSLSAICEQLHKLVPEEKKRFEVRLTEKFLHYFQIIRADDRMMVSLYLSKKGGSDAPTLHLQGERTKLFEAYNDQFEIVWGRATEFEENELQEFLQQLTERLQPQL
jgi:hypothetical protein